MLIGKLLPWSCAVVAVLVLANAATAAAQITTATLSGTVRDETGASPPGVSLTVRNVATRVTRTATTDSAGRYLVSALNPGEYEVRAELSNFKTAIRSGVVLTVGGTTEADIG
jgi:hypothetical protein